MSAEENHVRWPAEWEPQEAVWLAWPHNRETWPGHFNDVPRAFERFCRAVADFTPVRVIAGADAIADANALIGGIDNVQTVEIPTNDCWIRDYGPTFVYDGQRLVGIDWRYNAWGGKYPPWDRDAAVAAAVCRQVQIPRVESMLCLEGGAIETDGQGTVLTTTSCLLTESRNPGLGRREIEAELTVRLGAREVVWLEGGEPAGDDTDGHIDQIARFVGPGKIVVATCDDTADENHAALRPYRHQLEQWAASRPQRTDVVPLPLPPPRAVDGQRVPQSYCNFLISNQLVLVPTFRSPDADDRAVRSIRDLLPDHCVLGLDAFDLVWGLGAFHCASQQQPAARSEMP